MSQKSKVTQQFSGLLRPDDVVQTFLVCQIKRTEGMTAKRLSKDVVINLGAVAGSAVVGPGSFRGTVPAPVWIGVSLQRVMLFGKLEGKTPLGDVLLDVSRHRLQATEQKHLFRTITLVETETGNALAALNLGWRRKHSAKILHAVNAST